MKKRSKIIVSLEDKEKKILKEAILKKRQKLVGWITKNEMLRVELDMISKEYHVRVGSLYLRSNQQDLEIIYFQNLLDLLRQGFSYKQAIKKLDKTYYGQQKRLEEEKEKLKWEKEIFNKHEEVKTESE